MKRKTRVNYTEAQKTEMWDRWQKAESFNTSNCMPGVGLKSANNRHNQLLILCTSRMNIGS